MTSSRLGRWLTLVAIACGVPDLASADRRELYTMVAFEPGLSRYKDPITAQGDASASAIGGSLAVYYGVTNTWHLGAALHVSSARNARFDGVTVSLPDGSSSRGVVFADDLGIGAGALVIYRVDTGTAYAPVFGLEIGGMHHSYSAIDHVPAGAGYRIPFPRTSEWSWVARASLLLEYRFSNRLLLAAGPQLSHEFSGRAPWQLSVPVRLGVIW